MNSVDNKKKVVHKLTLENVSKVIKDLIEIIREEIVSIRSRNFVLLSQHIKKEQKLLEIFSIQKKVLNMDSSIINDAKKEIREDFIKYSKDLQEILEIKKEELDKALYIQRVMQSAITKSVERVSSKGRYEKTGCNTKANKAIPLCMKIDV